MELGGILCRSRLLLKKELPLLLFILPFYSTGASRCPFSSFPQLLPTFGTFLLWPAPQWGEAVKPLSQTVRATCSQVGADPTTVWAHNPRGQHLEVIDRIRHGLIYC